MGPIGSLETTVLNHLTPRKEPRRRRNSRRNCFVTTANYDYAAGTHTAADLYHSLFHGPYYDSIFQRSPPRFISVCCGHGVEHPHLFNFHTVKHVAFQLNMIHSTQVSESADPTLRLSLKAISGLTNSFSCVIFHNLE